MFMHQSTKLEIPIKSTVSVLFSTNLIFCPLMTHNDDNGTKAQLQQKMHNTFLNVIIIIIINFTCPFLKNKLIDFSDGLLNFTSAIILPQVLSLPFTYSLPITPSVSGTSWSESHLSVLRWIMSEATKGTKVRTQQLSKHQQGYHFQPGCWPHLRVNSGSVRVLLLRYRTDP